jgi:hypothetical protein
MFIIALVIILTMWEKSKCPSMDAQIFKMSCVQRIEYYLTIKWYEVLNPCYSVDGP